MHYYFKKHTFFIKATEKLLVYLESVLYVQHVIFFLLKHTYQKHSFHKTKRTT